MRVMKFRLHCSLSLVLKAVKLCCCSSLIIWYSSLDENLSMPRKVASSPQMQLVSRLECVLCVEFEGCYLEDRYWLYYSAYIESMAVSYSPFFLMRSQTVLVKVLSKEGSVCSIGNLELGFCVSCLFTLFCFCKS